MGPVEADGAVDAQNAPTAPWKTLRVFHELHRAFPIKSFTKTPKGPKIALGNPDRPTDIYWAQAPEPPADAIAEAEADQDLPGDPHLMLRLSAQFFRLTPSSQLVTLLHETIRMSLELTGKRLQQADDLSQGHFQGKTRSEQAFETQRIELARGLYLFPDEVMAEKHLQQDYPAFAADRLGHYNDIQGRTSENRDYETAEPGLEWPAALWFWLRNKLGALIATTDELGTAFGDRVAFFDARLRDLLPGDQYRRVTGLGRRLLAAGSGSPSVDEEAAGELFKLVVEIAYPRPPQQLH